MALNYVFRPNIWGKISLQRQEYEKRESFALVKKIYTKIIFFVAKIFIFLFTQVGNAWCIRELASCDHPHTYFLLPTNLPRTIYSVAVYSSQTFISLSTTLIPTLFSLPHHCSHFAVLLYSYIHVTKRNVTQWYVTKRYVSQLYVKKWYSLTKWSMDWLGIKPNLLT